jgi:hypothetical protein
VISSSMPAMDRQEKIGLRDFKYQTQVGGIRDLWLRPQAALGSSSCLMFAVAAGRAPLHPVSSTSDKELCVNCGGFCLAKRYFTAASCRWLRNSCTPEPYWRRLPIPKTRGASSGDPSQNISAPPGIFCLLENPGRPIRCLRMSPGHFFWAPVSAGRRRQCQSVGSQEWIRRPPKAKTSDIQDLLPATWKPAANNTSL